MTSSSEWPIRLKNAVEALERSPGAPEWLQWVLRDALTVAPALEPRLEAEPTPPTFFYPH